MFVKINFRGSPTKNFQLENFQNRLTIYCALVLLDSFFDKDPGSTPVNSLKGTRLDSRKPRAKTYSNK